MVLRAAKGLNKARKAGKAARELREAEKIGGSGAALSVAGAATITAGTMAGLTIMERKTIKRLEKIEADGGELSPRQKKTLKDLQRRRGAK